VIVQSERVYKFEQFSALLDQLQKSFTVELEKRDIAVTENDTDILMLEESAMGATGNMWVSNKRQDDNGDDEEQPTRKCSKHNKACNTTRGDTLISAMHSTCQQQDDKETK
jgi:hypothetical protein